MKISWQFIICFPNAPNMACIHMGFVKNTAIYIVTPIMTHHTSLCLPLSEHVEWEKSVAVFRNNTTWVSNVPSSSIPQTLTEMRR